MLYGWGVNECVHLCLPVCVCVWVSMNVWVSVLCVSVGECMWCTRTWVLPEEGVRCLSLSLFVSCLRQSLSPSLAPKLEARSPNCLLSIPYLMPGLHECAGCLLCYMGAGNSSPRLMVVAEDILLTTKLSQDLCGILFLWGRARVLISKLFIILSCLN